MNCVLASEIIRILNLKYCK